MTRPLDDLSVNLAAIDRVIHEPARLVILTALSSCRYADFLFLQRLTGLTAGNLSSHLTKLEEAGMVWSEKEIVGKRPHTKVGLTDQGRQAIDVHWHRLNQLREEASKLGKSSGES